MTSKIRRLVAFCVAFAMVFSLVGCGSDEVTEIVEEIVQDDAQNVQNTSDLSSQNTSLPDNSTPSASEGGVSSDDNSNTEEKPDVVDPSQYVGTTVKFAVTSDPRYDEKAPVIESFEKLYGIKIESVLIDGNNYVTELAGLIANAQSPDVIRSSGDFPLALSYLQSLDAAKIDYNDPIWEQGMFKMSTFNGSPYLCTTVENVYTETDIVVYRKDILELAGCKTPEQYAQEGNWNIDAFFEIARTCAKKVNGVKGCSFVNYDSAVHMSGNSVFKFEDGKYVNGFNDSVIDVFAKISDAKKEGIVTLNSTNGIVNGTVAIATHHSYALRKSGAFENYKDVWSNLGFYYLPSFGEGTSELKTGIFRGWGLVRGAQNPVAAGIFLRYFLDSKNFDKSNMYISVDAADFFFQATVIDYNNWNPYYTYGNKIQEIAGIEFYKDIYSATDKTSTQISNTIDAINSKIDSGCNGLNNFVSQNIYSNG